MIRVWFARRRAAAKLAAIIARRQEAVQQREYFKKLVRHLEAQEAIARHEKAVL